MTSSRSIRLPAVKAKDRPDHTRNFIHDDVYYKEQIRRN